MKNLLIYIIVFVFSVSGAFAKKTAINTIDSVRNLSFAEANRALPVDLESQIIRIHSHNAVFFSMEITGFTLILFRLKF